MTRIGEASPAFSRRPDHGGHAPTQGWRCVLLAVLIGLCLAASPAQARSWRIADFRVDATLEHDGNSEVTERLALVFVGHYNGIYRRIPIEYPGPSGTNYTLFLQVLAVTDGDGNALKFENKRDGAYRQLKIYVPGADDTTKTVEIRYRLRNAIRYFPSHDEFYWNVTGNDWPVPIDHASALVRLPEEAVGHLQGATAYTGAYGEAEREATVRIASQDVIFETTNPLPIRSGMTVVVALDKGAIEEPSTLERVAWFLRSNPVVFLPFFAFVVMFLVWRSHGKDPDPGISVAPMYEPPARMTPAECGALVDDSVDPRDITSTIVDLAVRGYLKIEQVKGSGWFAKDDYNFHRQKPSSTWDALADHERAILGKLFGSGEVTSLSSLRNSFYTALPAIKDGIRNALKSKGMYRLDPQNAQWWNIFAVVIIVAPFVLLHVFGVAQLFESTWLLIVAIAITVAIVFLFGRKMAATSVQGARTRVAVLGFQEFMNRVDADRLQRMPPDTFEKYLPYAMALGVEHRWAQAFAGIIQNPPNWYVGHDGYRGWNTMMFTNSLNSMTSSAQEVFASAPRSSSSGSGWGGGGGGGFSGGGFGGGGGGAF